MVIACKGIDILKRVLCLLLCVVLLFCFFMVPRAGAVALEATTVAYGGLLIGTILVGAGVVFSSHGDMVKVGNAMYKTLVNGSSAIGKTISSISAWAVEHGEAAAKGALRVGKELYQGIVDAFNALKSGDFVPVSGSIYTYTFDYSNRYLCLNKVDADVPAAGSFSRVVISYGGVSYEYSIDFDGQWYYLVCNGKRLSSVSGAPSVLVSVNYGYMWIALRGFNADGSVTYRDTNAVCNVVTTGTFDFSISYSGSIGVSGDLVYPSDDYLVKMPDLPAVDEVTGDVTYPSDAAYTKDAIAVPYPVDADGVKVPDIPYDQVVDQSTGKVIDDADTDVDNPSKPGEGTDTDNPSDSVNWPDTGSLSLPKLIASKFPFCIPFDVARLVGLLEAEPKAPVFHIPVVYANVVNEEIVIDFDKFADVLQIIRWGEIMLFVAGLVVITRNYIKW